MSILKTGKKKKIFVSIVIALTAVATATAIILPCIHSEPVFEIARAVKDTVEAECFTVSIKTSDKYVDYKVVLDFKKEEITMISHDSVQDDLITGIYGGYYFICSYSDTVGKWVGTKTDASEMIKKFFDAWDGLKDGDIGGDAAFDVAEYILNVSGEIVKEHIDADGADKAVKSVLKLLFDGDWLTECLGHKETARGNLKCHSFDINFAELSETADEVLSDCAKSSAAEYVIDSIVKRLGDMDGKCVAKGEITLSERYFNSIKVSFTENEETLSTEIVFSDIGSTKIDTELLTEYLDNCV